MTIILQGKYCHELLMYFYAKSFNIIFILIGYNDFVNGKILNKIQF